MVFRFNYNGFWYKNGTSPLIHDVSFTNRCYTNYLKKLIDKMGKG